MIMHFLYNGLTINFYTFYTFFVFYKKIYKCTIFLCIHRKSIKIIKILKLSFKQELKENIN